MSKEINGYPQISIFKNYDKDSYLNTALDVSKWLDANTVEKEYGKAWKISSGAGNSGGDDLAEKMTDRSIYSGAAGVGYFYIQLYEATGNKGFLEQAIAAGEYLLNTFTEELGKKPGIHGGLAGEGLFAELLYEKTKDIKYREYAIKAGDTIFEQATRKDDHFEWGGIPDYMGDGSIVAYWLYLYKLTKEEKYVEFAKEYLDYIISFHTKKEDGTVFWRFFDIHDYFPELPSGGILPNFAHGTAGIVYLLTKYYEATEDREYLELAENGFAFLKNIAINNGDSSIVPYLYLENAKEPFDVFYLSLCHGPVGDGIVAKELYKATGNEEYLKFYKRLTNALEDAGVTYKRSKGLWNDCICCGSSGIFLHFIDGYKLTKEARYRELATQIADKLIGDAYKNDEGTRWYNAWTRVMPWNVDAHIGLYMGSAGAASALISLYGVLEGKEITQIFEFLD
ncbi:MAG: glycoside hydrolase family 88 protein [Clostridium sp.]|nr:glycoside hydrolase family 88 protein [Clostridium sp.]MCM1208287.1 glycoside hydrolase family 88 protein [Ruminococcus sp.]